MNIRNLLAIVLKWRRAHLSANQFILIISFLVGIFTALAGLLLKWLIGQIEHFLTQEFNVTGANWLYLVYPVVGIFLTMQPALMLLKSHGASLGLTTPMEMFWATGALSSFLDNTPTYLVFLTTACSLGLEGGITTSLGTVPARMLMAISCGAVFMGANSYIGNAPNFMVKAISDENGVRMPSFFGYLLWSLAFLGPVFLLDALIFFR